MGEAAWARHSMAAAWAALCWTADSRRRCCCPANRHRMMMARTVPVDWARPGGGGGVCDGAAPGWCGSVRCGASVRVAWRGLWVQLAKGNAVCCRWRRLSGHCHALRSAAATCQGSPKLRRQLYRRNTHPCVDGTGCGRDMPATVDVCCHGHEGGQGSGCGWQHVLLGRARNTMVGSSGIHAA